MVGMKKCSTCQQILELKRFGSNRSKPDGLNSCCKQCVRARQFRNYHSNPQKCQQITKRWRSRNKERLTEYSKSYWTTNKDRLGARAKEYYQQNKEKLKEYAKKWKLANRARATAVENERRARQLKATPRWLTSQQKGWIQEWYNLAKWQECHYGGKWHVDHIVPLRGKNVSGLHVPWNLQVIPAIENIRKGNR